MKRRSSARVAALAVLSGVAAMFSAADPSQWRAVALVELFLVGTGVAALGAQATPATTLILPVAAGIVGAEGAAALTLASIGIVAGLAAVWQGPTATTSRALAAGVGVNALLRLPPDVSPRAALVAGLVGLVPLVVVALLRGSRAARIAIVVVAATVTAILALAGVAALVMRGDASDGVAMAQQGVEATQRGKDALATTSFAHAATRFERVHATATAWWTAPARVVPGLAPQFEAVARAADEGSRLTRRARTAIAAIDPSRLVTTDGAFDLDAIRTVAPDTRRLLDALRRARYALDSVHNPWLLPVIADPLRHLEVRLDQTIGSARNVADAVDLADTLLGAGGERTYLVLLLNPAEARELGGFTGGVALLHATDGRLSFERGPSIDDLDDLLAAASPSLPVGLPAPIVALQPGRYAQNWSGSPDVPTVEAVSTAGWSAVSGMPVDGVVTVDPYAMRALLRIVGPVGVDGSAVQLSAKTVVDYMLRGQYADPAFPDDETRHDVVADVAESAFEKLTTSRLPDPRRLARLLAPLVTARRLTFNATDPRARTLLTRIGLRQSLSELRAGDLLVTTSNTRQTKLDAYLDYDVDVVARPRPSRGDARVEVTVTVVSHAPRDLPVSVVGERQSGDDAGATTAGVAMSVYTSLDLARATIDGRPTAVSSTEEFGRRRHTLDVAVEAGHTLTVAFELAGSFDRANREFRLFPMPTANPTRGRLSVEGGERTAARLDRVLIASMNARS